MILWYITLPSHREHEQQQLLPNVVPDPTEQAGRRPARTIRQKPLSASTIRQRAVKSLDESEKRLKAIEVCYASYVYYAISNTCTLYMYVWTECTCGITKLKRRPIIICTIWDSTAKF